MMIGARTFSTGSWLLVAISWAVAASDEIDCTQNLAEARTHYALGRFAAVPQLLEDCLNGGFTEQEQADALALMVKTRLVQDRLGDSEVWLKRLMRAFPDFQSAPNDPRAFREAIAAFRRAREGRDRVRITSVSKTAESPIDAPATVVVVTAETIAARGYTDLEELFHDLPGFDMQRGSGDIYANINQRGYRSGNDRVLFLIDGVEDNNLWRNVAYISRQYPLGNVARVEVVYGPASTIYGANAFVGVINVITRDPAEAPGSDRAFSATFLTGGGDFETRFADATLAWRHPYRDIALSLTTRLYETEEADLSGHPYWDYDPSYYDTIDYGSVLGTDNQALIAFARALDAEALGLEVEGEPVGYSDLADETFVGTRLTMGNFRLGVQHWRQEEGYGTWYTDDFYPGARNGSVAAVEHLTLWGRYSANITRHLSVSVTTDFKQTGFVDPSREQQLVNYASGDLDLADLTAANPVRPYWRRTELNESSRRNRLGAGLHWDPSPSLGVVAGLELRQSLLQGDYLVTIDCPSYPDGICPRGENFSSDRAQYFEQVDLGFFAQVTRRFGDRLSLLAGLRYDHNTNRLSGGTFPTDEAGNIVEPKGYGSVLNPRIAVIRRHDGWFAKGIYAEAIKDASQWDRYATVSGFRELPNPALEPETVRNTELVFGWQRGAGALLEISVYRARYSNAVQPRVVPFENGTTLQHQASGTLDIRGGQARFELPFSRGMLEANATWTDPRDTRFPITVDGEETFTRARIADIAPYQLNGGITWRFPAEWTGNLRFNWSDARRTGPGTTAPDNPLPEIDAYLVFNAAVSKPLPRLGNTRLQLIAKNLADEDYAHPGVQSADGVVLAPYIPQPGRSFLLTLSHGF